MSTAGGVGAVAGIAGIHACRLRAQLLSGDPAADPLAVADRLLAIQAQDPRGFRLACRVRGAGFPASAVERALGEQRSLLVSWLNRGTLHLVRSEDYAWLHALTAPLQATANRRRLAEEGVDPDKAERAVSVVEAALAEAGPLRRRQLREALDAAGVGTAGQALVHILLAATLRGLIVRGPVIAGEQAFVLVRDWLGEPEPVDRDAALAELARRYLRGHGPARDRDLARWAGLPLRDVRRGLELIAGRLIELEDGLLELGPAGELGSAPEDAPPLPPPRLLGPFDPVLHGWESREPLLGAHQGIVTKNGIFRPIALVEGRAVGIWSMPGGEVKLDPFAPLEPAVQQALEAEADAVVAYLAG